MAEDDALPLEGKIKKWLDGQGYPLEMRTAQHFRDALFSVTPAWIYADLETKERRELDVIAMRVSEREGAALHFYFAVECKTTSRPWILLGNAEERFAPLEYIPATKRVQALLQARTTGWVPVLNPPLPTLNAVRRTSYAITEAFTTGRDVPYGAVMSVIKAALRLRGMVVEIKHDAYVVPVIVVGCPLFECYLKDGEIRLERTSVGALLWTEPFGSVYIVSEDGLAEFVQGACTDALALLARPLEP